MRRVWAGRTSPASPAVVRRSVSEDVESWEVSDDCCSEGLYGGPGGAVNLLEAVREVDWESNDGDDDEEDAEGEEREETETLPDTLPDTQENGDWQYYEHDISEDVERAEDDELAQSFGAVAWIGNDLPVEIDRPAICKGDDLNDDVCSTEDEPVEFQSSFGPGQDAEDPLVETHDDAFLEPDVCIIKSAIDEGQLAPDLALVDFLVGEDVVGAEVLGNIVASPDQHHMDRRTAGNDEEDAGHGEEVAELELLAAHLAQDQARGHDGDGDPGEGPHDGDGLDGVGGERHGGLSACLLLRSDDNGGRMIEHLHNCCMVKAMASAVVEEGEGESCGAK